MRRFVRRALPAALLFLIPMCLDAQPRRAPQPKPYHAWRVLAIGDAVFLEHIRPVVTGGVLWQVSLRPARPYRDARGVQLIDTPNWYLHSALTAGASFRPWDASDAVRFTGYGQLGLVRRMDSFITAWGPTAVAAAVPRAAGGALRAELLDNIGVQLGYVGIEHERPRVLVSIDYFAKLCDDLGFGWLC